MKKHLLSTLLAGCSILMCAFAAPPARAVEENPSMKAQFITEITADGSGSMAYENELSSEMVILLKTFSDMETSKICESLLEYTYGDWEQSQKESNGDVTCSAKKTFKDLDGLESLIDDEFSGADFDRLEIKDDKLYYDLAPHMEGTSFEGIFGDEVNIDIEANWILKVPGEVVSTNADTTSGRTLTWNLLKMDYSSHIRAESKLSGGGLDSTLMI